MEYSRELYFTDYLAVTICNRKSFDYDVRSKGISYFYIPISKAIPCCHCYFTCNDQYVVALGRTSGKGALDSLTDEKLAKKIHRKTIKSKKEDSLPTNKKLTVIEVRQEIKCKENVLQRNLKKLHLIQKISTIDLDPEITSQVSI